MRTPKKRGTTIGNGRINGWVHRFAGYHRQEVNADRVRAWLAQFTRLDDDLAARLLDCVTYLTTEQIESALLSALERLPGWNAKESARQGKWRFVPFSRATGESGDSMVYRLRCAARLTSARYHELFINKSELLKERLSREDTVVFVDDFAGTGSQACGAWEVMRELLPGEPRSFLLLASSSAAAKTKIETDTSLHVRARLMLDDSDNVFSATCSHFTPAERHRLLEYCRRASAQNPRGYGGCGFVLVLAHRTPNNSVPVLHASHHRWRGLFPR